jgi:hypothetical protein
MARDDHRFACTLDGTAMAARLARIRRVTLQNLVSHRLEERTLQLTYRLQAAHELERIVVLERECCAFLDFSLDIGLAQVVLTITVPKAAHENAGWLCAEFLPRRAAVDDASACGCGADATCR